MRARARAKQRNDGDKRLVGFVVGDVQYALDIDKVREIVNPAPTSAVPHMPDVVVGVAAYTLSTFANRLTRAPVDPQLQR